MEEYAQKIKRPSDSFFTKLIARSISVHITPLVAKTPITPLQVTILGLFIGLCAAWFGSKPAWSYGLLAAFLMEASHILDCVDGELARLTNRGSPFAAFFDPISDRIKDIAIVYAAFWQSSQAEVFNLSQDTIFSIAFFAIGFWLLYMYIVDAYLNPSRKKKEKNNSPKNYRVYIGLSDLFIYGCIAFFVFNIFEFFIFFILALGLVSVFIQIIRLKKILRRDYK